jgi:hypothetical protein
MMNKVHIHKLDFTSPQKKRVGDCVFLFFLLSIFVQLVGSTVETYESSGKKRE